MQLILTIEQGKWKISDKNNSLNQINENTIEVKKLPVIIGRTANAELPTIIFEDSYNSSKHAIIMETNKKIEIIDLSKNGTLLQKDAQITTLEKGKNYELNDDDRIILPSKTIIKVTTEQKTEQQKDIIEHNLQMMTGQKEGMMQLLIWRESIGGNAGGWGEYPCAGANFYYDTETGKITIFGNTQYVSKEIKQTRSHGILRLAIDYKKTGKNRIIELICAKGQTKSRQTLEKTIEEYNKRYGFQA